MAAAIELVTIAAAIELVTIPAARSVLPFMPK